MVDRIPLFPDDGTYPGFTSTEPEVLTAEQYQAGPVNYFAQALGPQTASLREETGVGVTKAPEVGREETQEDDPSPKAPSAILAATRPTLGGDISASGEISFDIPAANPGGGSYSKFLSQKGMKDRIPLVNIYEGMTYDNKEVNLFENIGAAVKEGGKKVADPKKAAGSMFKTVKNAFGNESFRGFGLGGAFADMVHSTQYRHLDLIRAARTAGVADTGFAMTLGDYGITRAPGGRTYTGNTRGMDIETIMALEAISKGYDPTQGRYNPLDPRSNQTVVKSGGIQLSNNPMDGFFRANGSVYNPRFMGSGSASAAYASREMLKKASETYGITVDEMRDILTVARSGTMNVRQALNNVLAPKLKAFQEKASQEMQVYKTSRDQRDLDHRFYGVDHGTDDTDDLQTEREDRERERVERTVADIQDKGRRETFATGFADGGRVGLAMGGAPSMASGFVERPPDQVPEDQTVADDKKAQLPEGAFVINAAAAEFMGTDDVRTMLLDAHKEALRQGLVVDKQGNGAKLIDVAISRGEVVVAPHLAKIIGYDRLTKINNRGKPETRERIQENDQQPIGVAEGGFIPQPTSKPGLVERRKDEILADVELRADLETYIKKDKLARLGWDLYSKGEIDMTGVMLRNPKTGKEYGASNYSGFYFPKKGQEMYPGPVEVEKADTDQTVMPRLAEIQSGKAIRTDIPSIYYYGEKNPVPDIRKDEDGNILNTPQELSRAGVFITMAHELRHAALNYIHNEGGVKNIIGSPRMEERLMDYYDFHNRLTASKSDSSVPPVAPNPDQAGRQEFASYDHMQKELYEYYENIAAAALKGRKVPPRAKRVKKGIFKKFLSNLFD